MTRQLSTILIIIAALICFMLVVGIGAQHLPRNSAVIALFLVTIALLWDRR
jgi:hypothetical protein